MTQLRAFSMFYCILTCCDLCSAREFGPEWTKLTDGRYYKEITVNAVILGHGGASYRLHLEHEFLQIGERQDDTGFNVIWQYANIDDRRKIDGNKASPALRLPIKIGHIDVQRKSDSSPALHTILLPKGRYLDLNGDGIFDVMTDRRQVRNAEVFILYGDRFILVQGIGRGVGTGMRDARSTDGTRYIFDDGTWRLAKLREAPPIEPPAEQANPNREPGPEWRKGKDPTTGLDAHLKELKVPVVHDGRNVANYTVQLERDRLQITEVDDNLGFSVSWQQDGRVDIRRKKDGTPAWHQVRFPNARYLDLNGDGIFDVMVDYRKEETGEISIVLDNRFVRVKGIASGITETMRNAESQDGTKYVFENGAWHVER